MGRRDNFGGGSEDKIPHPLPGFKIRYPYTKLINTTIVSI